MKRGQVWIETVLYTLIIMILIGAVLAYAVPKVEEVKDKSTIEQSLEIMQNIDGVILSVTQGGTGNKRVLDISIRKGTMEINPSNGTITFEVLSSYKYSESGEEIKIGKITAVTSEEGSTNKVTLTGNYSVYNLTYNGESSSKEINSASTPYKMSIENRGGEKTNINIAVS